MNITRCDWKPCRQDIDPPVHWHADVYGVDLDGDMIRANLDACDADHLAFAVSDTLHGWKLEEEASDDGGA